MTYPRNDVYEDARPGRLPRACLFEDPIILKCGAADQRDRCIAVQYVCTKYAPLSTIIHCGVLESRGNIHANRPFVCTSVQVAFQIPAVQINGRSPIGRLDRKFGIASGDVYYHAVLSNLRRTVLCPRRSYASSYLKIGAVDRVDCEVLHNIELNCPSKGSVCRAV